jgi:hypothetical protein
VVEWNPVTHRESTMTLKQLSVSEAVLELDMTGVPVIVFRHADTAASIWFTAARTVTSAGLIPRRFPPLPSAEGKGEGHGRA